MNSEQPPYQPPQQENQRPEAMPEEKKSLKLPIILMVWPTAGIVLAILLYALVNLLASPAAPESDLYGDASPIRSVANILLFVIGAASVLLGPISFIVGLVLLIQRKSRK